MNIQTQNYNSPQFTGVGIVGKIKSENIQELTKILSDPEMLQKIKVLERAYQTDIFLNTKVTNMTFKHKIFGNMSKYGMKKVSITDFLSDYDRFLDDYKKALAKAKIHYDKYQEWLDTIVQTGKKLG